MNSVIKLIASTSLVDEICKDKEFLAENEKEISSNFSRLVAKYIGVALLSLVPVLCLTWLTYYVLALWLGVSWWQFAVTLVFILGFRFNMVFTKWSVVCNLISVYGVKDSIYAKLGILIYALIDESPVFDFHLTGSLSKTLNFKVKECIDRVKESLNETL